MQKAATTQTTNPITAVHMYAKIMAFGTVLRAPWVPSATYAGAVQTELTQAAANQVEGIAIPAGRSEKLV